VPAWLAFQLTASIRVAGSWRRVRTWTMRDGLALISTVDQVAGVATVTVRGEFGSFCLFPVAGTPGVGGGELPAAAGAGSGRI
jgi:hypothetical protein